MTGAAAEVARTRNPATAAMSRTAAMLLMRIDRWDVHRDGPLTQPALEHKVRALGYDPVVRMYPAGSIVAPPPDARERVDAVVSGLIKVTIEGESAILTAGDLVLVPRGAARRLEVVGAAAAHCLEAVFRGARS